MIFHSTFRFVIATIVLSTLFPQANAQEQSRLDYSATTAEQLLGEYDRLRTVGFSDDAAEAIEKRAVELLLLEDSSEESHSFTWHRLLVLAEPQLAHLTPNEQQRFQVLLANLPPNQTDPSFDDLRSRVILLRASGDPGDSIPNQIEAWLASRDINRLSVDEVQWCLRHSLPNKAERRSFSVVWEGFLTPPRSGKYVFSVSPINVNRNLGSDPVRHRISISVAGTSVVEAGPPADDIPRARPAGRTQPREINIQEHWQWQGTPHELQANQRVPIRVEMAYECRRPSLGDSPSAILFWQGPGMDRRPVASNFLSPPDRAGNGLRAEYRFGGKETGAVVQKSPTIEYVWGLPADVAPRNPELISKLTQRLWQLCTDRDYILECAAGRATHAYFVDYSSTVYLSCAQRKQFLQLLQDTPDLLNRADGKQLLLLYRSLRFGAEDEGIDMLGQWMQLHADISPAITSNFFRENRQLYWELAEHLVHQLTEGFVELEDRYLEMPNGRCCLPVAYTISSCYLLSDGPWGTNRDIRAPKRTFAQWVTLLETKLEDNSLTGDLRVNWLLARANADETEGGPGRNVRGLAKGLEWLDEAKLIAETEDMRFRLTQEFVARNVGLNHLDDALLELNAAMKEFHDLDHRRTIGSWKGTIEQILRQRDREQRAWQLAKNRSYLKALRIRLERAKQRGDTLAIAHLEECLRPEK